MAEGFDWGCVNMRRLCKDVKRTRKLRKMRGIPLRKRTWKGHEPSCNLSRMMPTVVGVGCTCAEARKSRRSVKGQLGQLDWFENTVLSKYSAAALREYNADGEWGDASVGGSRPPSQMSQYSLRPIKTPIKSVRVRNQNWPPPPSRDDLMGLEGRDSREEL